MSANKECEIVVLGAKALADPVRVQILRILLQGHRDCCCQPDPAGEGPLAGVCVCDIMSELNMIQSKVSYHLAKLKEAHLVLEQKWGRWHYYSINQVQAAKLVKGFSALLDLTAGDSFKEWKFADKLLK